MKVLAAVVRAGPWIVAALVMLFALVRCAPIEGDGGFAGRYDVPAWCVVREPTPIPVFYVEAAKFPLDAYHPGRYIPPAEAQRLTLNGQPVAPGIYVANRGRGYVIRPIELRALVVHEDCHGQGWDAEHTDEIDPLNIWPENFK